MVFCPCLKKMPKYINFTFVLIFVLSIVQSKMMSLRPSVCLSVRLSLKITVTTEPIGFYSSGDILTGPVVVLGYFLGRWDTPNPIQNKKSPHQFLKIYFK